jgi:hypothetical protein
MSIAYAYKQTKSLAAGMLLLSGFLLGGCAASSSLMDARAEAPAPPKANAYLPVEDLPSQRERPAMTPDERSKLKQELIAARDRQTAAAKAPASPAPVAPVKP